ncbi:MAG: prepilin-type N-terminal cleavage/methylation domain-containing protein [Candidatus Muiribacteriota bacterium]
MFKNKKGITLIELMIVLAIGGLLLLILYNFFIGAMRRQHYKGIKQHLQQEARFITERFFMDVMGAHKVIKAGDNEIELQIYTEVPSDSELLYDSDVSTVTYSFLPSDRVVERTFAGRTRSYQNIQDINFKYLGVEFNESEKIFELEEESDLEDIIGVVMKVHFQRSDEEHRKEPEKFEVIMSSFLKTRNELKRFGITSPYGYFSSLEDNSF